MSTPRTAERGRRTEHADLNPVLSRMRAAGRSAIAELRAYYASRTNRFSLVGLAVVLCYGGGAAMFWLHAIYRGEQGPPIGNVWHWLLDSSLGFVALTPALLVLVPFARRRTERRHVGRRAVVIGGLFAVITTPGPMLHDFVAGAGTPLARLATRVFGADPQVAAAHVHAVEHSAASEAMLQLAMGIPVYILLTFLVGRAVLRFDTVEAGVLMRDPVPTPDREVTVMRPAA